MIRLIAPAALVMLAACSVTPPAQEVEAVRDYVSAAELQPVDRIRMDRNSGGYTYLNDYFVILPALRKEYLVEFNRRCLELRDDIDPFGPGSINPNMIDVRRDSSLLRARFDTIRGCQILTFYEITDEQLKELKNLGDAPGEEIFLPEDEN
ncbi:MAG: DUF6491 family protein [Pseudomonadota bacterium]